jgi:hypothetical protein
MLRRLTLRPYNPHDPHPFLAQNVFEGRLLVGEFEIKSKLTKCICFTPDLLLDQTKGGTKTVQKKIKNVNRLIIGQY